MPSSSKNTNSSSTMETSLVNQKQSFPTKDLQYCAVGVGQKNICYSNTSTTFIMVTTIQFSIPLALQIEISDGSLHCPTPIQTFRLFFKSQIEIVSLRCIFVVMFSVFLNIIYLPNTQQSQSLWMNITISECKIEQKMTTPSTNHPFHQEGIF